MAALGLNMQSSFCSVPMYDMDEWIGGESLLSDSGLNFDDQFTSPTSHPLDSPQPTYTIKRCQGFVRCDMDIDAEVVGWVIGKNGSAIKDLKNKTGCNMWVDQRALKLTITGPDYHIVEHAARSVQAYVAAAPIKAGAVEAAVTKSLDFPPHLLDILGEKAMIARIVKETRAQVVVNKKMGRAIVRGRPHSVQVASKKIHEILYSAAEQSNTKTTEPSTSRSRTSLTLPDHEIVPENSAGHGPLRSPAESSAAAESPFNCTSNRSWSLFSGPGVFSSTTVAPFCGTPQSDFNLSARSRVKFFATSPTDKENGCILSTNTSPLSFNKCEYQTAEPALDEKDPVEFEFQDLRSLLISLKLEKYASTFDDNEVDMDAIRLMSESDFKDLGLPKGPILKIMNAVNTVTPRIC